MCYEIDASGGAVTININFKDFIITEISPTVADVNGVTMNVGDMKAFDFNSNDHFTGFTVNYFAIGSFFMNFTLTGELFTRLILDENLGNYIQKGGICYELNVIDQNLTINSPASGITSGFSDCDDCLN